MASRSKTRYGSNYTENSITAHTSIWIKDCGWNTYDKITSIYCWGRVGEQGLGAGDFRYYLTAGADGAKDGYHDRTGITSIEGGINISYQQSGTPTTVTHTFTNMPSDVVNNPKTTEFRVQWHGSSTFKKKWRFFENHYITCYYESPEVYITVEKTTGCNSISGTGQQAEIGSTITVSATPENGYTFTKWQDNNTSNPRTYTIVDSDTYQHGTNYKTFTPIMTPNTYTLTFDGNGGTSSSNSKSVQYTTAYGTLPTASRTGYIFNGWFTAKTGGSQINTSTILNAPENRIVYAQWTPISYTIAFNGNGSTSGSVASISAKYASSYVLTSNSFKKIGYIFKNWNEKADGSGVSYSNEQSVSNLKNKNGETITLYAQWEFVGDINYDNLFSLSDWYTSLCGEISGSYKNTTNLIVDLEQGTINIQDISSTTTTPDAYTNYSPNSGYYHIPVLPNTEYSFLFNVEANNANDLGQFFVFYYTDKGASNIQSHDGYRPLNGNENICSREEFLYATDDKKTYIYMSSFKTPLDCTKIGMRFGIYSQQANITFSNIYILKKEIMKSIAPGRDYIPVLTSLYSPSRTGHTFNGWYTTEDYSSGSITLDGVKAQTSSLIVYSKWTPYTYTIKFDGNGANNSGIMADQSFVYGQSKTLTPNVFSRYRYRFIGWNTSEDGSGVLYEDQASILNITSIDKDVITLYAQWEYAPLEQSILIDNLDVKKILIDSTQVIEVFKDKTVFFRPAI